jgi:hypothetical protein
MNIVANNGWKLCLRTDRTGQHGTNKQMRVDPCQSEAVGEMKGGEGRGGCSGGRAEAEMEEKKSNRNRKS